MYSQTSQKNHQQSIIALFEGKTIIDSDLNLFLTNQQLYAAANRFEIHLVVNNTYVQQIWSGFNKRLAFDKFVYFARRQK